MRNRQRLTKGLAVAGTVLVWLPFVYVPLAFMVLPLLGPVPAIGLLTLFGVAASDLYPLALLGGCLLTWAALRARSHARVVGWGLAAQCASLALSLARDAGIGGEGPTAAVAWPWALTVASTTVLWLGWIAVAVAGVSLVWTLIRVRPQRDSERPDRRIGVIVGAAVAVVILVVLPTVAYFVLWEPAQRTARAAATRMEPSPVPGFGEPNDGKASATVLKPGQQVDGSLETTRDVDVYRIDHFDPARNGTIMTVGAVDDVQTDARGQVIGDSYSDPISEGTSMEGIRSGSSLNFMPGDVTWPLYIYVRRARGYTGKAEYRIQVPRAK